MSNETSLPKIIHGKKFNKKHLDVKNIYAIFRRSSTLGPEGLLFSPDQSIEELVKRIQIKEGIIVKEAHAWYVFFRRQQDNSYWFDRVLPKRFRKGWYVVKNGEIRFDKNPCNVCQDRVKGIVDGCFEERYGNRLEKCAYVLNVGETEVDLSKMRVISTGMLNKSNPFQTNGDFSELRFEKPILEKNIISFANRGRLSRKKAAKLKKYCSKCVFSCEPALIKTFNVDKKCCLTYRMAIKNGFFKQMKIANSTSIYREGVFLNGEKVNGFWNDRAIALTENKWNKK